MAEHPILFSTEMVRAILDSQKTQTRRVIKPQPNYQKRFGESEAEIKVNIANRICPYGKVGDTLWVRETTKHYGNKFCDCKGYALVEYKDGENREIDLTYMLDAGKELPQQKWWGKGESKWTSARFMFKWAARIFLEITNIRVERVQDITLEDVIKEGIKDANKCVYKDNVFKCNHHDTLNKFKELWDSINAKRGYGWDENPYVWVVEFKRMKLNSEPS